MALDTYRRKRTFTRTPEPRGGRQVRRGKDEGLVFVVQKHDATRLHYDLRLEHDGVLKSWAVPRGPSLDPGVRRLAVPTEDHPLEYGGFEGVIPKGQYGGGPVLLWDRGRWIPEGDPAEGLRTGRIKFRLEGEKLRGRWMLVRVRGEGEGWLLIKERDEEARPGTDDAVIRDRPESLLSGKTIEQIDRSFHRKATPAGPAGSAARAPLPELVEPQLATLSDQVPEGDEWLHEIKYDGYRALLRIEDGRVRAFTRNGNDWTRRFGAIVDAAAGLPATSAWIDGEVVVLDPDGTTSFQALQRALGADGGGRLVYYAFDLLHLDGRDLSKEPLVDRKAALKTLMATAGQGAPLRYSDHVVGRGPSFYEQACRHVLEGIVSKRADAPYRPGRGRDWIKVKCSESREFVIGGFSEPEGTRTGFGSLLLGEYDERGQLQPAGRVGTGFDEQTLRTLRGRLQKLVRPESPFARSHPSASGRAVRWVEPRLVAEVEYTERTKSAVLRHPTFRGLREDKPAEEVRVPPPAPARRAGKGPGKRTEGGGTGVVLTHPERILYPEHGITKRQLADYYAAIADRMFPHVARRPLTLVRCPEGREKCFYQKHPSGELPAGIGPVPLREETKTATYLEILDARGLVGLVQMGVLEVHVWGSRTDRPEHPDRMIFDLDPDAGLDWARVIEATSSLRQRLEDLGLRSFLKTTGGKGLHVVVPLGRRQDWDEVKAFSKAVAEAVVRDEPAKYTAVLSKSRRKGKIFIDYLRNGRGATAVSAWSTRARPGAPISVPLDWSELSVDLVPAAFTIATIDRRLAVLRPDPWDEIGKVRQSITAAMRRKVGLT